MRVTAFACLLALATAMQKDQLTTRPKLRRQGAFKEGRLGVVFPLSKKE